MRLADLEARGLLNLLDVELARALGRLENDARDDLELAIALTSRSVRRGHACLPLPSVAADVAAQLGEDASSLPDWERWVDDLATSRLVTDGPLVLDDAHRLYLRRYWQFERDIATELAARAVPSGLPDDATGHILERLFEGDRGPQYVAAQNALSHRVSVLCGGPGTGKTTTVAAIAALLVEVELQRGSEAPKVMLLAPTGKAAARLGEAVARAKKTLPTTPEARAHIPDEATTVHRALGMRRHGMRFARDAESPIDADVVVVDEASMVDLGLMRQLLVAIPRDATLLIVGDPDQLTSVEAGSVLRDLVLADNETWWTGRVTHLRKTYRYDAAQPLGQLVGAIRAGEPERAEALLRGNEIGDVQWNDLDTLDEALEHAVSRWSDVLATEDIEEHFEGRRSFVVLSPFRRGPIGTGQLGATIETRLEPRAKRARPIIIEENGHDLGIYNGDFGVLFEENEGTVAAIQREGAPAQTVAEARLPRFSQAFALSVHKAQGSEFDEVLIVLPEEDAPLLTRELLYTAVSRARGRVRLVGPQDVIAAAIDRRAQRHSGLVDRIARHAP